MSSFVIHLFMALYSFVLAHLFSVTFGVFPHSPAQLYLSVHSIRPLCPHHILPLSRTVASFPLTQAPHIQVLSVLSSTKSHLSSSIKVFLDPESSLLPNLEGNSHISKLPLVF